MSDKDYYKILEVEKTATDEEIKKAYKRLARKYHPDHNKDPEAEDKFKTINEANQILGNQEKRKAYDTLYSQPQFNQNDMINDILRSMNMGFGQHNPYSQQHQGKIQFRHPVSVSFNDAVFGCEINIDVPSYINCDGCNGKGGDTIVCKACNGAGKNSTFIGASRFESTCITCNASGHTLSSTCQKCNRNGYTKKMRHLKLKIPQGIQNQSILHIGSDINDRADVFIVVNVQKHPKIERNGNTLYSTEVISCIDALIGVKKIVEIIDGKEEIEIPAGTQYGAQIIIEKKGIPTQNGRNNHIVNIQIDIPKLTQQQIEKVKQIMEIK